MNTQEQCDYDDKVNAARAMLAALRESLRLADKALERAKRSSIRHPSEIKDTELPSITEARIREAMRAAIAVALAAGITTD